MRKSLVLGASTKPERYAYKCIVMLRNKGFETVAVGRRAGTVADVEIATENTGFSNVHTVNIYLSARNLVEYEDYILSLQPKRVLFPPGTENPEFEKRLMTIGIEYERACPLVMLSAGTY